MARSGQAGSRSQYHNGTGRRVSSTQGSSRSAGRGYSERSTGGTRRSSERSRSEVSQRRSSERSRNEASQRRGGERPQNEAPQKRSAIREGQGILGWLGTLARWVVLIILLMVFIRYGKEAYTIGYSIFSEQTVAADGEGQSVTVEITAAMTVDDIGEMLEQNGLLVDGSVFKYQERFSSYHGDIQPGTYTLSSDMTPTEILKKISTASSEGTAE